MFTTRQADITDAAAIAAVIDICGLFTDDEAEGFIDTLPDMLADEEHVWFVAEDSGIQGAAYLSLDGMSQDVWNLWFIGFDPDAQRRGGGSALVSAVQDHARAAGGRLLMVETSGVDGFEAVRAFYLAQGFAETARIPDYYAPGDDKVVFLRDLGHP